MESYVAAFKAKGPQKKKLRTQGQLKAEQTSKTPKVVATTSAYVAEVPPPEGIPKKYTHPGVEMLQLVPSSLKASGSTSLKHCQSRGAHQEKGKGQGGGPDVEVLTPTQCEVPDSAAAVLVSDLIQYVFEL